MALTAIGHSRFAIQQLVFVHAAQAAAGRPGPPESRASAARCTRIGASIISASAGTFRQLLASVSITSTPSDPGRAAAGDQKLGRHVAPPVRALAAEMHDDDLAAGIRRHAVRCRLAQCAQDARR